jgi:heterodisulfide reductase subunit B
VNDFGLDNLEKFVEKKLDLKVAPYYGCQLLRPPEITEFDHPENPQSFENLLDVLGCQVVDFSRKTDCCGATLTLVDEKIMKGMVKKILDEISKIEVDCISTICPLCHYALESSQFSLNMEKIPVLHATQLVGLSTGLSPVELGLNRNLISTEKVLKKLK